MLDNKQMLFAKHRHCLEVYDFIDDNEWSQFGRKSKIRRIMGDNDEGLLSMRDIMKANKRRIEKRLHDFHQTICDTKVVNLKDELNINDNYSINKSEFKKQLLPKLIAMASTSGPQSSTGWSALAVLQIILFNDWKSQKSKLSESALKASLIPQLISIYQTTNETEIHELIYNLYLLLCYVISYDNRDVRTLLLSDANLMISSTIRNINETTDENIIRDSLQLFQFYIYYSDKFEIISQTLSPVISLLQNNNPDIVIDSLHTVFIFGQSFQESRKTLIKAKVCKELLNLWTNTEDSRIIKPIFSIIASILVRLLQYKDEMLYNTNILQIIPNLVKSSELNKIYANHIIKFISMKPICAKKYAPTKQIQLIINKNTIQFINDLLENDNSFKVKSSALNAILVTAYNASLDQLKQLTQQGCLKALCSQLESNNECHLKTTLLAISVFLFEEYKDLLKAEKSRPNPTINLSHFALIIRECDGFRLLNEINERRVHKERVNEKYIVSEAERYVEEILFLAFGVESRPKKRQPKMEMMKNYKSVRTCLDCTLRLADTDIFECNHIQLCCKCAASALHKIYTQEPKQCQRDNCTKKIPKNDCPWYLFKGKLFGYYNDLQTRVEDRLEPEVLK